MSSISALLAGLGQSNPSQAAATSSGKKEKGKKRAQPSTEARPAAAAPADAALAAAFHASVVAAAPALVPADQASALKRSKAATDAELLGEGEGAAGSGRSGEAGAASGERSLGHGRSKRKAAKDSKERLTRTLFLGNLSPSLTAKDVRRVVKVVLSGHTGTLDAIVPLAKGKAAGGEGEAAEEAEEEEEDVNLEELNDSDIPDSEDDSGGEEGEGAGAGGAVPATAPGVAARIESVRLRSLPIAGTPIAAGSNYKAMRKACAITGALDSASAAPINAYVVFKAVADAEQLLCLNGELLRGHHIRADLASGSVTTADARHSVFVGSLPFTATEERVRALFAAGVEGGNDSIVNVRVVRDKATNVGKGIAFVAFKERVNVFQALALHGSEFEKRTIRVTHCKPQDGATTGKASAAAQEARKQKEIARMRRQQSPRAARKAAHAHKQGGGAGKAGGGGAGGAAAKKKKVDKKMIRTVRRAQKANGSSSK